jgi:hypothetical protein
MGFLAEQKKLESRTIWNKIQVAISMLEANGITRLLRQRDWPRYTESTPEVFTAEEIRRFSTTVKEKDVFTYSPRCG